MKQKTLLVLVGIPGSGKSTWAKNFKTEYNACHISRDSIRFSLLKDGESYFSHENKVFKIFVDSINHSLNEDNYYDYVIADATHLTEISRQKLIKNLNIGDNVHICYVYFNVGLKTCIERNKNRSDLEQVPTNVIKNMYYSMTDPAMDHITPKAHVLYVDEEGEFEEYE